jgi:hypothetical protein
MTSQSTGSTRTFNHFCINYTSSEVGGRGEENLTSLQQASDQGTGKAWMPMMVLQQPNLPGCQHGSTKKIKTFL